MPAAQPATASTTFSDIVAAAAPATQVYEQPRDRREHDDAGPDERGRLRVPREQREQQREPHVRARSKPLDAFEKNDTLRHAGKCRRHNARAASATSRRRLSVDAGRETSRPMRLQSPTTSRARDRDLLRSRRRRNQNRRSSGSRRGSRRGRRASPRLSVDTIGQRRFTSSWIASVKFDVVHADALRVVEPQRFAANRAACETAGRCARWCFRARRRPSSPDTAAIRRAAPPESPNSPG